MEPLNTITGRAIDRKEPIKEFKNLEIRDDVIDKLGEKESDILDKIQDLYATQDMLERKFGDGCYKLNRLQRRIEWKLEEVEGLKQYLYELYEKPKIQIVKLHKAIHHHGSTMDLVKERQLFKQIKKARGEAIQVMMSPPKVRIRWGEIPDTKEDVKELIEVRLNEIEELRIKRMKYWEHGRLDFKKAAIEKKIAILKSKLENIRQMKVEASKTTT
ncbi:hypothetical protein POM88_039828 [Heracleum sosnowskyi]|uniref:Uncharacterized protein n=1 Tax=Heracleum sosnowskyi TaxID=360622 RepID=A0AAD8HAU1_9APIA|nr:hypothetical protein POM88_039828 [Heracleum sosnowskyi]